MTYNKIVNFLKDKLVSNKYVDVDTSLKRKNIIIIEDSLAESTIVYIEISTNIEMCFLALNKEFFNIELSKTEFLANFMKYFNNYYDMLKTAERILTFIKNEPSYIKEISILNIEKYIEFVMFVSTINSNILKIFINDIVMNDEDIYNIFNIKYNHLLKANDFDLI